MTRWLAKLLDVRPGEGALLVRAAVVLFGLISAHTMLETARDALFLQKISASRLPLVYAMLAAVGLFIARANSWFVARFGRRNTLIATLLITSYGTVVLYRLPASYATVFALYVWSALVGTLLVAQFWMLCGSVFTLAQGRRLFGPISSGGVIGAVVGASVAIAVLRVVAVSQLLLISSGLFLATAFLLTSIRNDAAETNTATLQSNDSGQPTSLITELRTWPYLRRLVALIGVSTAAVLAADYLFKSTVARSLPAEQLGSFFATAYTVMNATALIVQLVLAQYLVRRIGIIAAYCVLPTLLVAGGGATVLLGGAVIATVLVKGADGALRHSLHRIATELLWLPLPDEVRSRVKTLVDTVVVRGVQALFAGVLLGLAMLGADGPIVLGSLIIGLSALWLTLAVALRRPYLAVFRNALHRPGAGEHVGELQLDLESVEVVVEALSSREPARAIAAMDLLASGNRSRLIPALILYHEAPEVLSHALDIIAVPDRTDWRPLAQRLLDHPSDPVRVAVVRALARIGDVTSISLRLDDPSPAVRGHAAFWLAERAGGPPHLHAAVMRVLAAEETDRPQDAVQFPGRPDHNERVLTQVALLQAMERHGHAGWVDVLSALARSEDRTILDALVRAVQRVGDASFLPMLIERLRFRHGRDLVRDTIVAMGEPALDQLAAALDNSTTDRLVRRHLPRTISRFRTQRAADLLMHTLAQENDGYVRYKALRGLGRLVAESPVRVDRQRIEHLIKDNLIEHLRLTSILQPLKAAAMSISPEASAAGDILRGLLEDKRSQSLDRAFRLLQIAHRREDVRSSALVIAGVDRKLRAQALEYLDALTLSSEIKEIRDLFRLIADDLPDVERIRRSAPFIPAAPATVERSLVLLLRDKDESVVGIAAHFALKAGFEELGLDPVSNSRPAVPMPSLQALIRHFETTPGDLSGAT